MTATITKSKDFPGSVLRSVSQNYSMKGDTPKSSISSDTLISVCVTEGNTFKLRYGLFGKIPVLCDKIEKYYTDLLESRKSEESSENNEVSVESPFLLKLSSTELWRLFEVYVQGEDSKSIECGDLNWSFIQYKCGILNAEDLSNKLPSLPPTFMPEREQDNVAAHFVEFATYSNLCETLGVSRKDLQSFCRISLRSTKTTVDNEYDYHLNRTVDKIVHSVFECLLPALPSGLRWKRTIYRDIIKRIELVSNETHISEINGFQNFVDAESSGLFPYKVNCYDTLSDDQRLSASKGPLYMILPIMLPWNRAEKFSVPIVALPYSDNFIRIRYNKLTDLIEGPAPSSLNEVLKIERNVYAEGILLQPDTRIEIIKSTSQPKNSLPAENDLKVEQHKNCALGVDFLRSLIDDKDLSDSETTEKNDTVINLDDGINIPITPKNIFPYTTYQNFGFVTKTKETTRIEVRGGHISTGIVINFQSVIGDLLYDKTIYPFTKAKMFYENNLAYCYHAAEMRDYLWRRCGKTPPSTHSFLLPFSPHMFDADNLTKGAVDLSKICNMSIVLYNNPEWGDEEWNISTNILSTNAIMVMNGAISYFYL